MLEQIKKKKKNRLTTKNTQWVQCLFGLHVYCSSYVYLTIVPIYDIYTISIYISILILAQNDDDWIN